MTTPDDRPSSPFTTPRFLIAAGIVVLVAVLGLGLVFFGGNDDDPAPPVASPTSTATSSTAGTTSEPAGSDCDLPAGDQTIPVTAPTDTEWELVGTVAAPTAPDTVGPAVIDPDTGLRSCYAANPLGALYAAVGFIAATTDLDQLPAVAESLIADGPGKDAFANAVAADPNGVAGGGGYQVAGYTFLSYDDQVASLRIAINADGRIASFPITLVREAGDWRVDLPPDGDLAAGTEQLPTLAGYVLWSGV